jgi:hypothetical protein
MASNDIMDVNDDMFDSGVWVDLLGEVPSLEDLCAMTSSINTLSSAASPVDGKPDQSYRTLVTEALEEAGANGLTLRQIYEWFETHYTYFRETANHGESASWRSSVRHNLVSHTDFVRRACSSDSAHKTKKNAADQKRPSWSRTARWILSKHASAGDHFNCPKSRLSQRRTKSSATISTTASNSAPSSPGSPCAALSPQTTSAKFEIISTPELDADDAFFELRSSSPQSMETFGFHRGPASWASSSNYSLATTPISSARSSISATPMQSAFTLSALRDSAFGVRPPAPGAQCGRQSPDHLRSLALWLLDSSSADFVQPIF